MTFDQATLIAEKILGTKLSGYAENDEAFLFEMVDPGPVSERAYVSKLSGKGHVMYFGEYCNYVDSGKIKSSDWKDMLAK